MEEVVYNIPKIIERSARMFPERCAFKYLNQKLTFHELLQKSNALSTTLIAKGVQKGDRVGIYMNRCLETSIAIYGITGAGAIFVPLDASAPEKRIQYLLKDCNINSLITIPAMYRKLGTLKGLKNIIGISKDLEGTTTTSWEEVYKKIGHKFNPPRILSGDLAYIIYTSGSTGIPKGIVHSHRSCLAYAQISASIYGVNEKDIVAVHAPLHFDISTFGYFTAPLVGATSVILSDAHTKLPASLSQLMKNERISIWYSVPLALTQLLQLGMLKEKKLKDLRWVLFGGEVFPRKYLLHLMDIWQHAKFSNVYGPTELNQCSYFNFEFPFKEKEVPLGKIWDNTTYRILDETNKPVLNGEIGVLAIRSETMMMGYWNNPKLTEASFYKEKTNCGQKHIFFITGDMVLEDAQGRLFFRGRKDRQVKIRGYRLELDEIEYVLNSHTAVKESAAFIFENEKEVKEISCAVIGKKVDVDLKKILKIYCQDKLPAYAVPTEIFVLNEFPRTTSDKIDRNRIKAQINSAL